MTIEEIEVLSSDEDNTVQNITLEDVIEKCGSFHRYQFIHFFFLSFFPIASGITNFYYVFGGAENSYECQVSNEINQHSNIEILSSQCFYRIKDYQNQTIGTYPCSNWEYDRTIFGETFTSEANLVCQHSIRRSFLSTSLQIGTMLIFFCGQITDIIGRRRTIQLLVALLLITSLVTQILLQFVPMSINQKFILLLINQLISGIDTYMVSFLLLMEITTSKYATFVCNFASVLFALGEIVVTGMAYLCRDWLLLKWIITLYVIALVPYLFYVPESPHWLLTKHRYDELEKLLRQIARCNRQSESKWLPFYRCVIKNHRDDKLMNQKNKIKLSFIAKIHRLVTHIPTMSKLIISGFIGFITLLLYIKISYNLGAMDEIDPYLNIIIGAIVEAVAYTVPSLFMIRYGRKPIFILFLILTVICLLVTPYTYNQNHLIIILIAQLGKFSISAATCVTYIFVPELFPTSIRGTGMGFFILLSRIGSTVGPIIDAKIRHNHSLVTQMYYLYAVLTFLCIVLTFLLPETRNVPLADKIDYGIKKNKKTLSNT
ncbi:unnamed protein product [Adineta steineri]|uniref:Major facilitator superfamily (MFS) profile domain-containing protein n=1 Tax=Adineta steineri TaxID=433720 RepID=A0A813MRX9_9BILA|nr:unnamed protein product [Adineta steineri]CAF1056112.1 unnamed protein product [Adineta steineri]CAF3562685.1 unnamed protein product [Adineta steineri]CAF3586926.1 unnamed protein product [Adineta steineri]